MRLVSLPVAFVTLVSLAAFAPDARAQATPPSADTFERDWPPFVAALEQAVLDGDSDAIRAARAKLLPWAASAPPARNALVNYAFAYACWRLSFMPKVESKEREMLYEEARDHLLEAVRIQPRWAEAHALLASVYGGQISLSPMRGMTLGPRAGRELEEASELAPSNPRVALQQGISHYHTPAMWGGGIDKAETSLRRAIELFASEPADRPWPNWGRFDAHAWLGQVLAKKGDREGARREYESALQIAPHSGWVTYVLLPKVKGEGKHTDEGGR